MTAPFGEPTPPNLEPMAAQFAELDAEALEFELEAQESVVAAWAVQVVTANAVIYAAFAALAAPVTGGVLVGGALAVLKTLIRRRLGSLVPNMGPTLASEITMGQRLGFHEGLVTANAVRGELADLRGFSTTQPVLLDTIRDIDLNAQATLDAAIALADELDEMDEAAVNNLVTESYSTVTRAQAATRWTANRSISEGVLRAAELTGSKIVWVPERNACLHCLAYAGLTINPGELFPVGLTMGDTPLKPNPAEPDGVPCPPLHPNCRCRPQTYTGPPRSEDISGLDVASVLWREARRSVVRGLSDYASEPARLRAAERLLLRGANLPKTVVTRARRDVKRGRFTDRPT